MHIDLKKIKQRKHLQTWKQELVIKELWITKTNLKMKNFIIQLFAMKFCYSTSRILRTGATKVESSAFCEITNERNGLKTFTGLR